MSFDASGPPPGEPRWVALTLGLFPVPIVAFAAAALLGGASLFFAIVAGYGGGEPFWAPCAACGGASALIAAASLERRAHRRRAMEREQVHGDTLPTVPTAAILAFLIATLSLVLLIAANLAEQFVPGYRPTSVQYWVVFTVGLVSTAYTSMHGRYLISRHPVLYGSRDIALTRLQAFLVIVVVLAFSMLFAWFMM